MSEVLTFLGGYGSHGVNFIICSWVLWVSVHNTWLNRETVNSKLRYTIYAFTAFQVLTMLSFMYNQGIWLANNYDDVIGEVPSLGWLLYDYFNSIFHLTAASLITHYIKGRCTC